jgi:hypothetical protein
MGALENIIALGRELSGKKADVNVLMDALPGALADIHKSNSEREERAEIRAEDNDWKTKNFNQREDQINWNQDAAIIGVISELDGPEQEAFIENVTVETKEGNAVIDGYKASGNKRTENIGNINSQLNQLNKSDFSKLSVEDIENQVSDIQANLLVYGVDEKSFKTTFDSINEKLNKKRKIELFDGVITQDILSKGTSASQVKKILLSSLSVKEKELLLKNAFKSSKELSDAQLQEFMNLYEYAGGDVNKGIEADPAMQALLKPIIFQDFDVDLSKLSEGDSIPLGYTDTGMKTSDGKKILKDAQGRQVVWH